MRWLQAKNAISAEGIEAIVYMLLAALGMTGAGLMLFLGKVYAAVLIGVVCFGIAVRFKRGRVKRRIQ